MQFADSKMVVQRQKDEDKNGTEYKRRNTGSRNDIGRDRTGICTADSGV